MRGIVLATLAAATALTGCTSDGYGPSRSYSSAYVDYDYNRPDPAYGGYYADRYYRDNRQYQERRLGRDDRVYRGENGRYYCRRSDGTTGLIVGGIAGGLLGNLIAPGGSEVLGTVLGAAAGAAVGSSVDKNEVRCR
ncbi:MAG: glycine zipper 2TM domain-containing protein [Pseudomonadota bacterium]